MENTQNPGMNSNEKLSASTLMQQQPSVPSIFLGPVNPNPPPLMETHNTSTNQMTQTSVWNSGSGVEMQRVRSPPSTTSNGSMDAYKMKSCASTQCGSNYEGLSNMPAGACQQSIATRMYPPYMQQQQQQMAMPIRSMHQHHHHGIAGPCHPHHPSQSMGVAPHLDRMMHSAVASASGNGPYMEYSHPHHPHHGPHGISAAAAAAAQYAHQQQQQHQRMVNSAAVSLNPYRQLPTHHHQKVINASQAAAAYQSAYQHQYNQYHGMVHSAGSASLNPYYRQLPASHQQINSSQALAAYQSTYQHHHQYNQYHGMVHPHSHPHHQNGPAVMQQRMLGIPIAASAQAQQQQQARMVPYLNRTCQPHLVSNYATGAQHQQHLVNHHVEVTSSSGTAPNSAITTQASDLNNNQASSKSATCPSSGTKSLSKKASTEALIVCHKGPPSSSLKVKISTASPEKSVKIKATRSVTKLRDRQPRLSVGQKKKSVGNIASSSSRKLKSLKTLNSAVHANGENSGKRLTSSMVESDDNGDAKRRKAGKTEDVLVVVNCGVRCDAQKVAEESIETKAASGEDETVDDSSKAVTDNYFLEEQTQDEYVPIPEEMRKYLERLNTCNNLNIPLYYAYSVFHGKLSKKDNLNDSSGNSSSTTTAEGTVTTTTTSSTIYYQNYHHHHRHNQQEEFNIATYNNNNNWNDAALSADSEWQQFQDDMAVLEAYFPVCSTMEQSERAEKLDTIYSYEGQMKLMNPATPASCPVVVGGDQISPPCNCVQDTTSCSCCYNYLPLPPSMGSSPEECGGTLADQIACRNSSFVGDSPQQYVMETSYHPQPHFMSTPLSSRPAYANRAHYYDEENGYYFKETAAGSRTRLSSRKRSSSYPSRKSGRRTSGSRDHLKSETESFLDELISTANDDKLSKNKNSSGEVTAPEIQCELDFPTLAFSAAVPYSKRQTKKSKKVDESLSARDEYYMASSSSGAATEESESSGGSACSSSSPQSTHNTSSDGDFEGGNEIILLNTGRVINPCSNSKRNRSIMLPPSCGHFSDESGSYCYGPHHLWDDFRGDEVVALPSEPYTSCTLGASSCVPVSNLNHLISHCTCRRVDPCPTRPPPGFEHLARPAFPIELYDASLLGNLISGQLPREVLASLDASAIPKKQFEEMEELLLSLTCCEKHAVDKILNSRKNSFATTSATETEETENIPEDDWETLDKAIKSVLNEWTEELGFRRRMQDILYSLNLHDIFGGCCKRGAPEQPEQENTNYIFGSSSLSKCFASEESASIFFP